MLWNIPEIRSKKLISMRYKWRNWIQCGTELCTFWASILLDRSRIYSHDLDINDCRYSNNFAVIWHESLLFPLAYSYVNTATKRARIFLFTNVQLEDLSSSHLNGCSLSRKFEVEVLGKRNGSSCCIRIDLYKIWNCKHGTACTFNLMIYIWVSLHSEIQSCLMLDFHCVCFCMSLNSFFIPLWYHYLLP